MDAQPIPAVEARQRLGELLNRVSLLGEEITIERAGKPLAKLTPIDRQPAAAALDFRDAAGLGQEVWADVDVEAYVRGEREGWA